MLSRWVASGADFADAAIAAASGAILASEINDLQMERVPARLGEGLLQISLRLDDVASPGQTPALCQTVNMRIDRKGRHSKRLRHDDAGGFVADAGQFLQRFQICGHLTVVVFEKEFAQAMNRFRFLWR